MKTIYIRWLGAYRGSGTDNLSDVLWFERKRTDEAACEFVHERDGRVSTHVGGGRSKVGVLIKDANVFRWFKRDCWSERNEKGRLYATQPANTYSDHTEAWVHMHNAVYGVVVYGEFRKLSEDARNAIRAFLRRNPEMILMEIISNKLREVKP